MKKEVLDVAIEKTNALIHAEHCCKELQDAAGAWLKAVGTENEKEETKKYIAELEEDIVPIDDLIQLAESENGIKLFGEEAAKEIAAHGKEIKAAGAAYCDCAACSLAEQILKMKVDLLV